MNGDDGIQFCSGDSVYSTRVPSVLRIMQVGWGAEAGIKQSCVGV
jgi:hypothetical protein